MLPSGKEFIPSPFRVCNFVAFALIQDIADHAGSELREAGGSTSVSTAPSVARSAVNQTLLVATSTEHLIFFSCLPSHYLCEMRCITFSLSEQSSHVYSVHFP